MPWPFPWQHFLGRKPRDDDARLEMSKNSPGPRSFSSFSKLADDWWAQNPTSWGNCSSKWQVRRYHLMYSQSAHVHSLVQPQPTDNFFFWGKVKATHFVITRPKRHWCKRSSSADFFVLFVNRNYASWRPTDMAKVAKARWRHSVSISSNDERGRNL